jgi:hypothetical protein
VFGFVVAFVVFSVPIVYVFAYRTTGLGGSVELGATGVMIVGLAWLAIAVGFVVAAAGVWRRSSWALGLTSALAIASLVVCALGLPETGAGIVVNVAILAAVVWTTFIRRFNAGSVAEGRQ